MAFFTHLHYGHLQNSAACRYSSLEAGKPHTQYVLLVGTASIERMADSPKHSGVKVILF